MTLDTQTQEVLALTVVGLVGFGWGVRVGRKQLAPIFAEWLLARGHVKWAMKLKAWSLRRKSPVAPRKDCHD